ncbi:MAG: hypothetical protein CMG00_08510 [Candidatus Marinimicrobia bacterium]|nr:hypothetical protein [Candidatus Neomarinimicrobiota bacterium]|tara:strand:- start:27296 stop:28138 length:843 start_codon:yes stop_codon:yes gene_type:complete
MERISRTFILFLIFNITLTQFINFSTNIDIRKVRDSNKFYFENLSEKIDDFFLINSFGPNIEYLDIEGNLHLMIESVAESNNGNIVSGQLILTNKADIIMLLKGFSFPTRELQNISLNQNSFNPLSSLLEFSAYMLIANELDTYDSKGGNPYYNMAQLIAISGKESDYPKGWEDRWKKCKEIQDNFFLRDIKYYFFLSYDDFYNNQTESFKNNVFQLQEAIIKNDNFIGLDNNTKNFFNAYSREISKYYYSIKYKDGLKYLSSYNAENKTIYQSALDTLK